MPYLFLSCLLLALFNIHHWAHLPIYPDEITYQAFVSRAFFDDWHRTSFMTFCESSARMAIPFVFAPAAFLLSAYTWLDNMHVMRAVGIGFFLGTCLWAFLILRPYLLGGAGRAVRILVLLCAMAIWVGVLPSVTFMLRAEHFIFLAAICALALALRPEQEKQKAPFVLLLLLPLLYSFALYTHPKAAFIAPALVVSAFFAPRAQRPLFAIMAALICVITGVGAHMQSWQLLHCPESPALERLVNGFSINPLDSVRSPAEFFMAVSENITAHDWLGAIRKLAFMPSSDIGYLPPVDTARVDVMAANMLVFVSLAISFMTALGFFLYHAVLIFRRKDLPAHIVLLLLQVSVFAQILLNRQTTFYDIGFWVAFSVMVNVFSIVLFYANAPKDKTHNTLKVLTPLFAVHLVAAVASAVAMHNTIFQAYEKGFPEHRINLVNYDYNAAKENTLNALGACGLSTHMPQLVYDDFSYPFLKSSPHALAVTYLLLAAGDGGKARAWLDKNQSSGIVAACPLVEKLKKPDEKMGQAGPLCCLKF